MGLRITFLGMNKHLKLKENIFFIEIINFKYLLKMDHGQRKLEYY
jgi:hypothetical protein